MSQLFVGGGGGGGGGGGDVTGPGSSTDKAVVRWNGTNGMVIQDSSTILTDGDLEIFPVNTTAGIAFGSSATQITSNNTANTIQFQTNSVTAATINSSQNLVLANALLPASGGTGVASPTAHGVMVAEGASAMTPIVLGAGQVLIGTTASDPVAATLTAGTGIAITSASGSITISTSGGQVGTAQTANTTPTAIITHTPTTAETGKKGTYRIRSRIAAYNKTQNLAAGYEIFGTVASDNTNTRIIGTYFRDDDEEGAMSAANVLFAVSGNTWIVQVVGIGTDTINWSADSSYVWVDGTI